MIRHPFLAAGDAGTLISVAGAVVVAILAFFGTLVKLIADSRNDVRDLQTKIMDRAIPALEQNAEATKKMVDVTQEMRTALAVFRAQQDTGRNNSRPSTPELEGGTS